MGSRGTNLTGTRFGAYVVLGRNFVRSTVHWWCQCDCGKIRVVYAGNLRSGKCRSCGCKMTEHGGGRQIKYGKKAINIPEYNVWRGMKGRCNGTYAKNYSGRGIVVCEGWQESFEAFYGQLGSRPSPKHTIDRIDNDGNYSCGICEQCVKNGWPMNCKWSTNREQLLNTRSNHMIEINGETKPLTVWAAIFGISNDLVNSRINTLGWSPERALTQPPDLYKSRRPNIRLLTYNGETLSMKDWSKKVGVSARVIQYRLNQLGMTIGQALTTPLGHNRQPKRKQAESVYPPTDESPPPLVQGELF